MRLDIGGFQKRLWSTIDITIEDCASVQISGRHGASPIFYEGINLTGNRPNLALTRNS